MLPSTSDNALTEILNELKEMRSIMEQFQKFVLEVTPDAAIEAIEELEEDFLPGMLLEVKVPL